MSSSKRSNGNDGKILASLEPGSSASKVKANKPPIHDLWRKSRNSLLLVLGICLVWFTYDNATSEMPGQETAIALAEPARPALAATVAAPEQAQAPATAMIREELVAIPVTTEKTPAIAAPVTPPMARPTASERIVAMDKAKPANRPALAKKAARQTPAATPDAASTDSDVAILSAIVAQGHAAKAAAGR